MATVDVVFRDRYGLHPRAAMRIQQAAGSFRSRLTVSSLDNAGRETDARSMVSLVSLGIRAGERVRVTAEGEDEAAALDALKKLMEGGVCHP